MTYAAGEVGEAFQFNGTNSYIAIPPSADVVGTGAFAVSAWIKTGSDGLIIQQRDSSNFNGEYVLQVLGGKINFWDYGNSEYGFNMTSNESVANNQWHLIVAVRLANGTGQIFIDGQLDSTAAGNVVPIGSNVNVYIGADYRNLVFGYSPEYFNGLIDEVTIDHAAPSALQIEAAYQRWRRRPDLHHRTRSHGHGDRSDARRRRGYQWRRDLELGQPDGRQLRAQQQRRPGRALRNISRLCGRRRDRQRDGRRADRHRQHVPRQFRDRHRRNRQRHHNRRLRARRGHS